MFDFLKKTAGSAGTAIVRGFDSIESRLATIGHHLLQAIEHPFAPPDLKVGLPMLLDVIDDLRQEVAELRKPCPCAPSSTASASDQAAPAAPLLAPAAPLQVDLTSKWPKYSEALEAFRAGEMSADEAAAFKLLQARVDAFAQSVAQSTAHG